MKFYKLILLFIFLISCSQVKNNFPNYKGYAILFQDTNLHLCPYIFLIDKDVLLEKNIEKIISSRFSIQIPIMKPNAILRYKRQYFQNSKNFCSLPPESSMYYCFIYVSYRGFVELKENEEEFSQECGLTYSNSKYSTVDTLVVLPPPNSSSKTIIQPTIPTVRDIR